jgi:tetratricopeptide (TPR) repeat protein
LVSGVLPSFDSLWDYARPEDTEKRFRDLLPAAQASGDVSYLAQLLTQIARTEGLQRRFEAAHRTLDAAEALLDDERQQARIRYLLERGRAFNSAKQPAQARALFLEAWQLAVAQREDFHAVDAAHMLAIVEPEDSRQDSQLEWNLRAIELAEASADARARGWLGSLYNNTGWTYHARGAFEDALRYFRVALEWQRAAGKAEETRIAWWCVARALRSLGRVEEALAIQRDLRAQLDGAVASDGFVEEELGECLLALGKGEEARGHLARAYAALSQDPWLVEDEPERLRRLKEMSGAG